MGNSYQDTAIFQLNWGNYLGYIIAIITKMNKLLVVIDLYYPAKLELGQTSLEVSCSQAW